MFLWAWKSNDLDLRFTIQLLSSEGAGAGFASADVCCVRDI